MKTKFYLSLFALTIATQVLFASAVTAPADIPAYYAAANGKSGTSLYNALNTIANVGFHSLGYDGALTAYQKSDVYPADSVGKAGLLWDMYGACSFSAGDECGNYKKECDCYNREHSVPKSWWGGGKNDMYSDIFHLVPTDGYVNNRRSNYAFGEVENVTYTYNKCKLGSPKSVSTTQPTLLGTSATCDVSPVFEPRDEYKGDFARGYLGMIAKYSNTSYSITSGHGGAIFEAFKTTTHFGLTKYGMVLLMKWHREDPVSQKEIDRNNGIQETQGNRNPFIDYPYLAEYIWGEHAGETVDLAQLLPSTDPDFIPGVSDGQRNTTEPAIVSPKGIFDLGATDTEVAAEKDIKIKGVNMEDGELTLAITNDENGYFSLSTYTVTSAQAEAETGYHVTVTYAPKADGNHTATLTINGCGVTNHSVTLTGSCTVVHTITWKDATQTRENKTPTGSKPVSPGAPDNCSETRVFLGWTANENVTDAPEDLFVVSPAAAISAPATYYAVYADKEEIEGTGETKNLVMEDLAATSGTLEDITIATAQNNGQTAPRYNSDGKDLRIYAKGSITLSAESDITQVVFHLSEQGLKRLAKITPSEGAIATQTSGDTIVTWTGEAESVTFTVGQDADYGSESNKAGQLCFTSVEVSLGEGGSVAVFSNYSLECSTEPENPQDVELVESSRSAYKVLINGHLFILRDNRLYDATGRRIQ